MVGVRFATILSILLCTTLVAQTKAATAPKSQEVATLSRLDPPRAAPPVLIALAGANKEPLAFVLRQYADRKVFLHLWAPNCAPCRDEIRTLDRLTPALDQKGITVLAIAQDPDGAIAVPAFARRYGIAALPLYIDDSRALMKALGSPGIPATYAVDNGQITASHAGIFDWEALTKAP